MGAMLKIVFGWREIFVSTDSRRYHIMKKKLSENGIKHLSEVNNPADSGSRRSLAVRDMSMNTYYIYVKANDVEKAKHIMNS